MYASHFVGFSFDPHLLFPTVCFYQREFKLKVKGYYRHRKKKEFYTVFYKAKFKGKYFTHAVSFMNVEEQLRKKLLQHERAYINKCIRYKKIMKGQK